MDLAAEGPPCLPQDSFAYRFAGFGTHEWVIYYDLVRHLLWSALENLRQTSACRGLEAQDKVKFVGQSEELIAIDSHIARLEELKSNWLEQPQAEYGGRIPAILIDNERKRLPIALRPRDMIIDEECPMCQMFGDETTPLGMGVGFWHLDGSHMDNDFAFSSCKTREEWEAENHRREEFDKEFNRRWKNDNNASPAASHSVLIHSSIRIHFRIWNSLIPVWSLMNRSTTTKKSSCSSPLTSDEFQLFTIHDLRFTIHPPWFLISPASSNCC